MIRRIAAFLFVISVAWTGFGQSPKTLGFSRSGPTEAKQVLQQFGNLPLSFEINRGQVSPEVRFLSRGAGYQLFLTSTEAVMTVGAAGQQDRFGWAGASVPAVSALRMRLAGSNGSATIEGSKPLPGRTNYFLGNNPKEWRTNVEQFAEVRYHDVYPGVDLVYYGNQGRLEHDFVVAPGADAKRIRLSIEGAEKLTLDSHDALILQVASGELQLQKPVVYQEIAGARREVQGRYVLKGNEVGFEVGPYDHSRSLVIDPVLVYSSYLGGNEDEGGNSASVVVDAEGNAYIASTTQSLNYPTTTGSLQPIFGGAAPICDQFFYNMCGDAVVTKINATGTAIVYSTYLGGNSADATFGLAIDAADNVYVSGLTESTNFPVTAGVVQPIYGGGDCTGLVVCGDAFVTKINPAGSAIVYSTYLGGSGNEYSEGVAVDGEGNAYVTGETVSANFPTTPGAFQPTLGGEQDAFVTKLNATGTKLLYSSFLGGSNDEIGFDIKVDAAGRAHVTGFTGSTNFPTTSNAYQRQYAGDDDIFATVVNASGTQLLYSTYFGGSGKEWAYGSALDSAGNYYVTGFTGSSDFPVTPGAVQTVFGGGVCNAFYGVDCSDAFVVKLNPLSGGGVSLVYSTYVGGSNEDAAASIAVDALGDAYITGWSYSTDFPLVSPLQAINKGLGDAFVSKLNPAGTAFLYSTYLGGGNFEGGAWISVDQGGNAFVAGDTQSSDFPTTPGAFQPVFAGGKRDLFVAKIGSSSGPSLAFSPVSLAFNSQALGIASPSQVVIVHNVGSGPLGITSVQTTGDFSQTNTCGTSLAGGGSCAVSITFSPTVSGSRTGTLSVADNASGSPQTIVLAGTGR